jgi:hypothetical protein
MDKPEKEIDPISSAGVSITGYRPILVRLVEAVEALVEEVKVANGRKSGTQ